MDFFRTLHSYGSDEYIVEKSKFIGHAKPVQTEEEARMFVEEIKQKYKDATHNVWAYTIGQNMNIQRYSDDGEPQGTAGIPTLELIKKEDLRNVVVVVTRYFGGIKLGAGGLVRAYTKGAKLGLDAAKIVEKRPFVSVEIEIEYTLLGKIQNELSNNNYFVKEIEYADKVKINVFCESEKTEGLNKMILELTNANAKVSFGDEFYLSVVDGRII
ncbi:MAG: YigZ family protein [Peptostreptococcus porci]|uniref:YigZ family protein n=1 Tax=Peptostreptococcus porci TaxID=2652282 RepID=A0A6N7WZP0_9FIRM|nr:YigZ family protein [Peptostreptococcus porci]MDD7182136.1 YigZ family protein [Peptostreptococcus porci]MDY2794938.1 YigZ family protein [Peptostreptococcus porci]MDY4129675.1 YigZ family protein [Peptostreptococcus porci]MDY5480267.1 YigZ family protein [Peptostreptococcus porci]MDY5965243.1 YigZ family protein [Peptostreptococcus porci]